MNLHVRESVTRVIGLLLVTAGVCLAGRLDRYALVLEDPPLAALDADRKDLGRTAESNEALRRIESRQDTLRAALSARRFPVTGSVRTLANAVFVAASESDEPFLRGLPGVRYIQKLQPVTVHLDAASTLMNVPAAWNSMGGGSQAGAGVKIGILDTGIDHTHPAFQDGSLPVPAGFPKCQGEDCNYTNRKIVAARSYVSLLVLGHDPRISRPDDLSPRDRSGHGTGVAMIAAGGRASGPAATVTGVAPKAYLGNYKIFGSPGVNDVTLDDAVLTALEDAFNDGMDIVNLSLGAPAVWGPSDRGSECGREAGRPCDIRSDAVENAARRGMVVVVSAGNSGDAGSKVPFNSIETPGTAPSAITVGASYNSHIYYQSVRPAGMTRMNALFGNGPKPGSGSLTASLRDVSTIDNDGLACAPLPNGSLAGVIALIERGECTRDLKVMHAQKAGAVGAIIFQWRDANSLFPMRDLRETGIPAVLIGNRDGLALRSALSGRPDLSVTLDVALLAVNTSDYDAVSYFSSQGPSIGDGAIKPELVAVGTDLYLATQSYDPNGEQFDTTGFTAVQGTSFAAPMVSGAAALVKQKNPRWTAAQIKSALVNTADDRVGDYDANGKLVKAFVRSVGAGKLNAAEAVKATVTAEPATLSFGVIGEQLPTRGITLRNGGSANASLRLAVSPAGNDAGGISLSLTSLTLAPNQAQQLSVRLQRKPAPGAYEGYITVTGGGAPLKIPYLYVVSDGVASNVLPLRNEVFVTDVSSPLRLTFKLTDQYGAPVAQVPVRFRSTAGGGSIDTATEKTDSLGIAEARVYTGAQLGTQAFTAEMGSLTAYFDGRARLVPAIQTDGVVNAASGRVGQGLAPGSYISIFGRGLSEALRVATTPYLPLSLAGVSVSFDIPARRLSVPGRLHFVSENQVNVQIPWELQGASSVQMKVSIGDSSSAVYTVPLLDYSPGVFEFADASGRLVAAALDERFQVITTANPVAPGRVLQLYVNGLGPVDNGPASGEPSPAEPLARTRVSPIVTVAGRQADVLFSGLAPGFVGLYQVNLRVPAEIPAGVQALTVTVNGIQSKSVNLPIQ